MSSEGAFARNRPATADDRSHVSLVVRSSSGGDNVARGLDHLMNHPRDRELQFSTPREAIVQLLAHRNHSPARSRL
jgi:hypothetical protein